MHVWKSERPDFVVDCNGRNVGTEHTETITENATKDAFLRSKRYGRETYVPRRVVLEEPRTSSWQLTDEVEADTTGGARFGDSVERSRVEAMLHFIHDKGMDANKARYGERGQEKWVRFISDGDLALKPGLSNVVRNAPGLSNTVTEVIVDATQGQWAPPAS